MAMIRSYIDHYHTTYDLQNKHIIHFYTFYTHVLHTIKQHILTHIKCFATFLGIYQTLFRPHFDQLLDIFRQLLVTFTFLLDHFLITFEHLASMS